MWLREGKTFRLGRRVRAIQKSPAISSGSLHICLPMHDGGSTPRDYDELDRKEKGNLAMTEILSRRSFIARSSAAGAAVALTTTLPNILLADPLGRAPGIQLYTVAAELAVDVP